MSADGQTVQVKYTTSSSGNQTETWTRKR